MNKQQFFRLTIVLTIPFIISSWWLGHQDFIFENKSLVKCSVENGYCFEAYGTTESYLNDSVRNSDLTWDLHNELILRLQDFNFPISTVQYNEHNNQYEKIDYLNNGKLLETNNCTIFGLSYDLENYYRFSCPQNLNSPYINGEFTFGENAILDSRFKSISYEARTSYQKRETKRIFIMAGIFTALILIYLLLSLVIRFVIYGFAKNGKL